MENLEEYTVLDLLQVLEFLEEETSPTCALYQRQKDVMKEAAKCLDIEPKDVGWLCVKKRERRGRKEREKAKEEDKREKEKKKERKNQLKLHNQLLVEMQILNSKVEALSRKVTEIEKSVTSLSFKEAASK